MLDLDAFYKWLNPDLPHAELYSRGRLLKQAPVEVSEAVYDEFLGMLPPLHFTGSGFAICEATTADVRLAFFRTGGRCFAAHVSDTDRAHGMAARRSQLATTGA